MGRRSVMDDRVYTTAIELAGPIANLGGYIGVVKRFWRTVRPRIHIIGGPGSGKTYVAAKLAVRFGVPAYNLDDIFWDSTAPRYGVRADVSERDRKLAAIVSGDGWIIEGVYYQWLAPSFDVADVIVALTPSVWVRHWRVVGRFLSRKFGRIPSKRESVADLWHLLRWSHAYDGGNLIRARKFVAERGRNLIICRKFDDSVAATEPPYAAFEPPA
jgi:adenylate kinase family enzyme